MSEIVMLRDFIVRFQTEAARYVAESFGCALCRGQYRTCLACSGRAWRRRNCHGQEAGA